MSTTPSPSPSPGPASEEAPWDVDISGRRVQVSLRLRELIRYRSLIKLLVYRDFVIYYRQTILGPLWWLLQPIVTCGVFTIIFGMILRVAVGNVPPALFYLSGLIPWFYFSSSFSNLASTFSANARLFEKVFFPRLVMPISLLLSNLLKFAIQFSFFSLIYLGFLIYGAEVRPTPGVVFIPLILLYLAALAMGLGLLFNSLTYKYRDLALTLPFIIQMWMFLSCIIHPASRIPLHFRWILYLNPVIPAIESFRHVLFGIGTIQPAQIVVGIVVTLLFLVVGLISFAHTERSFLDTM